MLKSRWQCFNTSRVWTDSTHHLSYQILKECSLKRYCTCTCTLSCDTRGKYQSCCTSAVWWRKGQGNIQENEFSEEGWNTHVGKQAAEHGVLATVCYYTTKLPEPLKESLMCHWKNAYIAQLQRLRKEGKDNQKVEELPAKRRGCPYLHMYSEKKWKCKSEPTWKPFVQMESW